MPFTPEEWEAIRFHAVDHDGGEFTDEGYVCWECQNEVLVPLADDTRVPVQEADDG